MLMPTSSMTMVRRSDVGRFAILCSSGAPAAGGCGCGCGFDDDDDDDGVSGCVRTTGG